MVVENKDGRKIEIMLMGDYESPQVDDAYYLDSDDEEVTDDDLEYILGRYDAEILEHLLAQHEGMIEDYEMVG